MPRVSVVMAVYNGQRYLGEALTSIVRQDFEDFELIIVDDGSKDETPAILDRWAALDPRITCLRNEQNRGIPYSLNRGIEAARGEYIARHDHDDISEQGRFRSEVDVLDSEDDVVLVSTNLTMIDADDRYIGRLRRAASSEAIAYQMHFFNVVAGHGQVMFRRADALAVGGYRRYVSDDYDLWARLLERGRFVILPIFAMRYRVHDSSFSRTIVLDRIRVSNETKQRMLSKLLGREVSAVETDAIAHVWDGVIGQNLIGTGEAVMREAFAVFLRQSPPATAVREIRREKGSRILIAGMLLASRGHWRELPRHVRFSLGWSATGWIRALRFAGMRAVYRVRRWLRGSGGISKREAVP
jgi:glycosyltransferase involved in cell wall biosynthesis